MFLTLGICCSQNQSGAREKVGGLLRDRLHSQYKSSSKAKVAKRRARKAAAAVFDKNTSSKNRMLQQQQSRAGVSQFASTFKNFDAAQMSSDFSLGCNVPLSNNANSNESLPMPFDGSSNMPSWVKATNHRPHISSRNVAILSNQLDNDAIAGGMISRRVNNNGSASANVLSFVEQAFGVMKDSSHHLSNNNNNNDLDNMFGDHDDLLFGKSASSYHRPTHMSNNNRLISGNNTRGDITDVIGNDIVMFPSSNALPVALDDSFFDM